MELTYTPFNQLEPSFIADTVEAKRLDVVYSRLFTLLGVNIKRVLDDSFIHSVSEDSISRYEQMFGVIPNKGDSLDLRREKILAKLRFKLPFTWWQLINHYERIFGKGNYQASIDPETLTLRLELPTDRYQWSSEIQVLTDWYLPLNIRFVVALTDNIGVVNVATTLTTTRVVSNYQLDGRWRLGEKPFQSTIGGEELIPMSGLPVQDAFLNNVAAGVVPRIGEVKLNGEDVVFTADSRSNSCYITFTIPDEVTRLQSVQVFDKGGTELISTPMMLDVTPGMKIAQKIQFERRDN